MFIETLELENVRTFAKAKLDFVQPDRGYAPAKMPLDELKGRLLRPRLPNVNLLLGDNGSGKTTVLRDRDDRARPGRDNPIGWNPRPRTRPAGRRSAEEREGTPRE